MNNKQDRAMGALMGALIGEALGVGPHWYYDLSEQHKYYGTWIDNYTAPQKGRYHEGLKPGELSQQGYIIKMMAKMLAKDQKYTHESFKALMDNEILPQLDGTAMGGIGGYTSQVMRHLYDVRVKEGKPWSEAPSISDTSESLERNIPLGIFYADDLASLCRLIAENTAMTQSDNVIGSLSVGYNLLLAMLIQGEPLDEKIGMKLMDKVKEEALPFFVVTSGNLGTPKKGETAQEGAGLFASPDGILSPSFMAKAAKDPDIRIEPAWKVSYVYGMPCAIYHMLPAAYYLAARFSNDYEAGVLHAINGGGQNQVRAMLTGALIGAQVGLSGINQRFIDGLVERDELLALAKELTKKFAEVG